MKAGIESIAFYVPRYYLDLKDLAEARGVDPAKFYEGIGQERMAVPPPDEDVVTMAATAASHALAGIDRESIDTIMFATESGIDQSKAAAIYVHSLLGLPSTCKAFELKQACCSGTAGLMLALDMVRIRPEKKVLIVAADVARYGFGTAGEPTQGAGAVAMVISSNPTVLEFEMAYGGYTEDVMDFWRPNYRDEAFVDGKYSIRVYVRALAEAWKDYAAQSGRGFEDHFRFCYHLPFTRMAEKAHQHLVRTTGVTCSKEDQMRQIQASLAYNRNTGNIYTASLYVGLASLLEHESGLEGRRVGLFSYGSGCLAYFFSGIVAAGYRRHLQAERHRAMLEDRIALGIREYEELFTYRLPTDGREAAIPEHEVGLFRLAGIKEHQRQYAAAPAANRRRQMGEPPAKQVVRPVHSLR